MSTNLISDWQKPSFAPPQIAAEGDPS